MAATEQVLAAMSTKDEAFSRDLGARIAQARKDRGMSQQQLADRLGVAQQTLAHYEVGRVRIAVSMLPALAEILDLSIDEMVFGRSAERLPGKRGPTSRLQQQMEAISQLPRAKQRVVSEVLEAMLAQHAS